MVWCDVHHLRQLLRSPRPVVARVALGPKVKDEHVPSNDNDEDSHS